MVGIRSPDGLVVGSCTSHPGVLGSVPKREEPGKTGAQAQPGCAKVPGSSRVPLRPRLVVSRSTCPPLTIPPHTRKQLCNRYCSNKTHTHVPFQCQARDILPVAEKQSRTRGNQSSRVEDQPQCRGLCHSSSPSERSFSRPFSSSPSFTQSPSPPRSLVRDGQTSPCPLRPWLAFLRIVG